MIDDARSSWMINGQSIKHDDGDVVVLDVAVFFLTAHVVL
jgi:hypothetical protein